MIIKKKLVLASIVILAGVLVMVFNGVVAAQTKPAISTPTTAEKLVSIIRAVALSTDKSVTEADLGARLLRAVTIEESTTYHVHFIIGIDLQTMKREMHILVEDMGERGAGTKTWVKHKFTTLVDDNADGVLDKINTFVNCLDNSVLKVDCSMDMTEVPVTDEYTTLYLKWVDKFYELSKKL